MVLITAMVLCDRFQDSYCQSQYVGYLTYSRLLDLRAEEIRVIRHVKPPACREASVARCLVISGNDNLYS